MKIIFIILLLLPLSFSSICDVDECVEYCDAIKTTFEKKRVIISRCNKNNNCCECFSFDSIPIQYENPPPLSSCNNCRKKGIICT